MPEVGRTAPDASHTQSVIFSKEVFMIGAARAWIREHNFRSDGFEETDNSFRFRQFDPESSRFRYRSQEVQNGITFILGFPK